MFEKESKEYANNWLNHVKDLELQHKTDEKPEYIRILEAHQKGAEYGYNLAHEEMDYLNKHWGNRKDKANEWHYVKDGDLSKEIKEYLVYKIDGYGCKSIQVMQFNNQHCWCANCQNEIKAWKEIVLPELPKESE